MEHYWPKLSGPDTPGKPPRPPQPSGPVVTLVAARDSHAFFEFGGNDKPQLKLALDDGRGVAKDQAITP